MQRVLKEYIHESMKANLPCETDSVVANVVVVWQWTVENARIVETRLNLEVQAARSISVS